MIYITTLNSNLVAASLLLLQMGLAAAGSTHHHHTRRNMNFAPTMCKDRPGVQCELIVQDWDCDKFTIYGESYEHEVCPVSCGWCEPLLDEISTDQLCYPFAKKTIDVNFSNLKPHHEDWVGIFPATADPYDLGSPVAWNWLCGDKSHKCRTSVGYVIFPWLPPGTYKAVMSRNRDAPGPYASYGPYKSYAESAPFEVTRGNICASRRLMEDAESPTSVESSLRGTQQ